MIVVKVTYTVKSNFVETNRKNVEKFISDVNKLNEPAIRYYSFLGTDRKTFTHIAIYGNKEAQERFLNLSSFKSFQENRNASGLEKPEHVEILELVASA
jgi:hypothetical protein